jgi:hypothetical protein
MSPIRALLPILVVALLPVGSEAQVVMRPEPPPAQTAGQTAWYRSGEPVLHRGELFYPGGPPTFFDRDGMVLVGEFRGVPLYADPTLETGSIVYVPVSGTLMQPYEKLRAGDLAGTSGSRMRSYPPETPTTMQTEPQPVGTSGVLLPAPQLMATGDAGPVTSGRAAPAPAVEIIAPSPAVHGRGIWIAWNGAAWSASGPATRVGPQMIAIGSYGGRTVYRGADARTIWIETAQGLVTPWRR